MVTISSPEFIYNVLNVILGSIILGIFLKNFWKSRKLSLEEQQLFDRLVSKLYDECSVTYVPATNHSDEYDSWSTDWEIALKSSTDLIVLTPRVLEFQGNKIMVSKRFSTSFFKLVQKYLKLNAIKMLG